LQGHEGHHLLAGPGEQGIYLSSRKMGGGKARPRERRLCVPSDWSCGSRPWLADAPAVLVFRGDPRVQRFNDEPLRDVAAAEAFIRFLHADSASDALSAPATNASSRIFPSK
jgi:hypothetical protein